jgi:hypothetical protein
MPAPQASIAPSAISQSGECECICINPERVLEIWPLARGLVKRAFESGIGDSTFEETEHAIMSGLALLWLAWDGSAIIVAVTTELVKTPRHKICLVTSCGGTELASWVGFMRNIEAYASAEGCDVVRVMGRRGWKRALPEFHEPWIVLDKALR